MIYRYGKAVHKGQISKQGAVATLFSDYGMDHSLASDYLKIFEFMIIGGEIHRENKLKATEYYLENILLNCGSMRLESALRVMLNSIHNNEMSDTHSKYLDILRTIQMPRTSVISQHV